MTNTDHSQPWRRSVERKHHLSLVSGMGPRERLQQFLCSETLAFCWAGICEDPFPRYLNMAHAADSTLHSGPPANAWYFWCSISLNAQPARRQQRSSSLASMTPEMTFAANLGCRRAQLGAWNRDLEIAAGCDCSTFCPAARPQKPESPSHPGTPGSAAQGSGHPLSLPAGQSLWWRSDFDLGIDGFRLSQAGSLLPPTAHAPASSIPGDRFRAPPLSKQAASYLQQAIHGHL